MGITDVLESTTALDSSSTAVDASRFLRRRPSATTGGDEYDKNLRPNIRGSDSSPPDHASFNGLLAAKSSEEVKDRNDAIENPNLMEPEKDPVTRPRVEPLPVFSLSSFLVEKMAMQKHMFEPGNNCSFGWISTVYIITRRLLTEIVIITTVAVLHPVFMILREMSCLVPWIQTALTMLALRVWSTLCFLLHNVIRLGTSYFGSYSAFLAIVLL